MTPEQLAALYPEAHFLLCRADNKAPVRPWLNYRPNAAEIARHRANGSLIGVVPWTLGYGVLDIDSGNPLEIALNHAPPAFTFHSRRQGGAHLWYPAERPHANRRWEAFGCAGETRCANGYVVLWPDDVGLIDEWTYDPDPNFAACYFEQALARLGLDRTPPPPLPNPNRRLL